VTGPDEKRWLEALEKLDVDTVRAKLDYGHTGPSINASVRGIVESEPLPSRGFVEAWLAKKAARWAKIAYATLVCAAIGAVASVVSCMWQL
jgi:hypothetical protein